MDEASCVTGCQGSRREEETLKLYLDPWPPDYDPPVQIDESLYDGPVDVAVESAVWQAICNPQQALFGRIYFIDGARRIDARVLTEDAATGKTTHGLFGTTAVGCVESDGERSTIPLVLVRRMLILGNGIVRDETLTIGSARLEYTGESTHESSPDEALARLQNIMRDSEARLGQELMGPGACVFADGPLTYFTHCADSLIGVVKKIQKPYLDPVHFDLVKRLEAGARTPLFHIPDPKHERYSWYLRLVTPRRTEHPLAGILRLEVRSAIGVDAAVRLADFSALELPRFASSPVRDARAPQNLVPVGALEAELRRHMGDPLLIRRAIEKRLSLE
jgi:uncharacterized protein